MSVVEDGASEGIRIMRLSFHMFLSCCGLQRCKFRVRPSFRIKKCPGASKPLQIVAKLPPARNPVATLQHRALEPAWESIFSEHRPDQIFLIILSIKQEMRVAVLFGCPLSRYSPKTGWTWSLLIRSHKTTFCSFWSHLIIVAKLLKIKDFPRICFR